MEKIGQEWVSASVDGETDRQTLAELAADTDSRAQWQRYHLIGDAMRGDMPESLHLDLSSRIAAALEDEPTILAPQTETMEDAQPRKATVVPFMRQIGQYGIAAAVALMAVVGVQNYQAADETQPMPVFNTRPLVGSATPVSLQTGPVVNQNQGFNNEQVLEQRRRINAYLQDHMLQQRLNSGVVVDDNSEVTPVPVNR
ncbi:RseA family anti-sigma factor [Shewanella khirikhana]|uniref:Anti-sigma-E factor RseA n=1 Tax=Shewanella khirikhana TaxID=1965282 RepID=A0ABN5TR20_9GAMM|nr:RseA family anti-sigma factor [Shewanella khirikhana]AZQ09556.1 Anti-sigma-E factor RseA [Shewanella khirikhana]